MNLVQEHPKALEARKKSATRALEKQAIKHVVATQGVRFLSLGRYTFCYRVDKRNVIEVSSAIRHPGDKNDSHVGRMQALARFAASNRMHLRMPNEMRSPRDFLTIMFMNLE